MKATLEDGDFGCYLLVAEDGRDLLFQTDWDFPGLASMFGFVACECGKTDGTISCQHKTASQMISEAREFLDDHIGDEIDASDYFGDDE